MATKTEDDLFAESTMSFGDHLEELRVCLWRAVLGLVIGFGIGLYFGKDAVALIRHPLEKALQEHYTIVSPDKLSAEIEKYGPTLKNRMPYGIDELRRLAKSGLTFDIRWVDPRMLADKPPTPTPEEQAKFDKDAQVPTIDEQLAKLQPVVLFQSKEDDERTKAKSMSATEPFMLWMKAALLVGVLVSAPWVFYQIWLFVAAGLYKHERKYMYVFLPISLGLFFAGAATAYFFVFEPVLNFLFDFNRTLDIDPDTRINEWLGFVMLLPLGFGVSFQLPLVMLFLQRIGVFSVTDYIQKWRIAVLAIFILSAVLTPADPYSLFFMAVPLVFLYFAGILLAKYLPGRFMGSARANVATQT